MRDEREFLTGFTLIETIFAIAILTTGILGGLALAVYSLGASDVTLKQITATNLAREGLEAVRSQRDYNWMNGVLTADCSDIGSGQACYQNWTNNIEGTPSGRDYWISYDSVNKTWSVSTGVNWTHSRLAMNPETGLYEWQFPSFSTPQFYRQVTIYQESAAPFTANNPRMRVVSTVWWVGKNCPAPPPPSAQCRVVLEDYLTNWKNY